MIFDSHAHYYSSAFNGDRDELLNRMHRQQDVRAIVCPSENMQSAAKCVELGEKYGFVYAAVGIHPCYADVWQEDDCDRLLELTQHEKVVALGEMGLDYYRGSGRNSQKQKHVFVTQLEIAKKTGLPVIIHDREAHGDMYDILRHYQPQGVMHCFSGSVELAREALRMGLYIGLGGSVTAANAVRPVEVAKYVPLDRLVLETDAPYMIPAAYRAEGYKRSESWMIRCVAERIAALRHMDTDRLLEITAVNAANLYGVKI